MYECFNQCDASATAECFTDDVVYEDLLLGNATIVESREEFRQVIGLHPVFVAHKACELFGLDPPDVKIMVDGLAEDKVRGTVGVEWHVELGGEVIQMGRGLSFMEICPKTGLISRAVDIAEAPWRTVGTVLGPFCRSIRSFLSLWGRWGAAAATSICLRDVLMLFILMDRSSMDKLQASITEIARFSAHL